MNEIFKNNALSLLKNQIPKFKQVHPSLISVLRANSEINLSNLLAYFFSGEYSSYLKNIFLDALIDCISFENYDDDDLFLRELQEERGFENTEILKEYQTVSGRIDILIINNSTRSSQRSAIIIENKLYHEVNNDFDDYFYSVSNDFNIEPRNIAVIILSLKAYQSKTPSYMKNSNPLHSELKNAVQQKIGIDLNLFYENPSGLLLGEYIKHIDDLYLDFSSYENAKCFEYYSKNRKIINKTVSEAKRLFKEDFSKIAEIDKKMLFENRTKIEQLIELHEDICKFTDAYFEHYIKIADRNVQGADYFRGRGLAYDVIRYKLDYKSHLISGSPIVMEVWLNYQALTENGIDCHSSQMAGLLKKLEAKIPSKMPKTQWFLVNTENLEIDQTMLNSILKNTIDNRWRELEIYLSDQIRKSQIDKFIDGALAYLQMQNLDFEIIEEQPKYLGFHDSIKSIVKYTIKFSPPDLVEIILYVNTAFLDKIYAKLKKDKDFIKFSEKQSYRIPYLNSHTTDVHSKIFEALLKRSFRISSIGELHKHLDAENEKWLDKEKEIEKIIDKYYSGDDNEEI